MARKPGVVSVFPDPLFKLHTTHSWDFLKYQTALEIHSFPDDSTPPHTNVSDTIIGILDTGGPIYLISIWYVRQIRRVKQA